MRKFYAFWHSFGAAGEKNDRARIGGQTPAGKGSVTSQDMLHERAKFLESRNAGPDVLEVEQLNTRFCERFSLRLIRSRLSK